MPGRRGTPGRAVSLPLGQAAKGGGYRGVANYKPTSRTQFIAGDRVNHGLFGEGIVLKAQPAGDDEEVTVAFAGNGTKTLLASLAKLKKL